MEESANAYQSLDAALAEIEQTLEQMLTLARLSATDLNLDRDVLEKTLKRLQDKIDRIADTIEDGSKNNPYLPS
ncbi:MAG: hypothetical protein HFG07_02485 [Oscillibacter sp.]|nr:hypothetical protein [Oscillibacter sp.]